MFASEPALKQHKADFHGSGAKKRKNRGPKSGANAPVAMAVSTKTQQTNLAHLSGQDYLLHVENVSQLNSGSIVMDALIVPGLFKRLGEVAGVFQRIEWLSLVFKVVTQVSTATSGGYVAGFVRDPDDGVPHSSSLETLQWLTAQTGAVSKKWWESASVNVGGFKRLFYTTRGVETREYSPGKFVLVVDGQATQAGSVTVYCDWKVRLSMGSMEHKQEESALIAKTHIWSLSGHAGVWCEVDGTIEPLTPRDRWDHMFTKDMPSGTIVKLPAPLSDDWSSTETGVCWFLKKYDNTDVFVVEGTVDNKKIKYRSFTSAAASTRLLIPAGTVMEVIYVPQPVENRRVLPSSGALATPACSSSTKDSSVLERILKMEECLRAFLEKSGTCSEKLSENPGS